MEKFNLEMTKDEMIKSYASKIIEDALKECIQCNILVDIEKYNLINEYKKDISEVVYIENTRSGQIVHFINGEMRLSYKPIKSILKDLNSDNFIQCSRYAIINKDYIDTIDPINRYITLKVENEPIEIGITIKNRFMKDILNG